MDGKRLITIGRLRTKAYKGELLNSGGIPPLPVGQGIPVPGIGGQGTWDQRMDAHPAMFGTAIAPGYHMPYGGQGYPMTYGPGGVPVPVAVGGFGHPYPGWPPQYAQYPQVGGLIPNQIQVGISPDVKAELDGMKKHLDQSIEKLKQPSLGAIVGLLAAFTAGIVGGRMWQEYKQRSDDSEAPMSRQEFAEALQDYAARNQERITSLVEQAVLARLGQDKAPTTRRRRKPKAE